MVMIMERLKRSAKYSFGGFRAGDYHVPPLEVGPGEIVKISFPSGASKERHLAEQWILKEAHRDGRAATVELAMPPSRWREMFHWQTTAEWLIAKTGMTREQTIEKLNRVEIKPDAPLCVHAGNPRWMLGLIAAMHDRPDVLVFTTTGCDATGMERGLAAVSGRLGETAAVYLSCFNGLDIVEPDYAAVLEVQSLEQRVA
jgi:hypothetical protein